MNYNQDFDLKKSNYLSCGIIMLIGIIFSGDTLIWGTNLRFSGLPVIEGVMLLFIGIFSLLLIKKQRTVSISQNTILIALLIIVMTISGMFFTPGTQNLFGYMSTCLVIIAAALFTSIYEIKIFIKCMERIIMTMIIGSLICYLIFLIYPTIYTKLPVITNIGGRNYYWLLLTAKPFYFGNGLYRNSCIFREPGVFQMYINFLLMLKVCVSNTNTDKKKLAFEIIILLLASVTTFSTGGLITSITLLFMLLFSKGENNKYIRNLSIVVLLVLPLFYMFSDISFIDDIFEKITDSGNASTSSRTSSIWINLKLLFQYPLFGVGATSIISEFAQLATSTYSVTINDNTNTIMFSFAAYGLIVGSLTTIGLMSFFIKISKKVISIKPIVIVFTLILFSNENVYGSFLFFILVFYGYMDLSKKLSRQSTIK